MNLTKYQASLDEFREATLRLAEVLREQKSSIVRDSAIKRFEMGFDLAWKTLKSRLEEDGIICTSPAGCFREGFRQGFIELEDPWIELTKVRNQTVHTYDEELAEDTYKKLPKALETFQKLLTALESKQK